MNPRRVVPLVALLVLLVVAALAGPAPAQRVVEGNVPELLIDRRIVVLDLAMMVAGSLKPDERVLVEAGTAAAFLPQGASLQNYADVFARTDFHLFFFTSLVITGSIVACGLLVNSLAAYAFARYEFRGHKIAFALVLVQLMITPEILIVENYVTLAKFGLVDTILGIGLPYMASAFGIFLLRQAFKSTPKELEEAARLEGCGTMGVLWKVYVPLARPTYLAYGLVSISHHWNNFLWPLIVTNSVETRPLTVHPSVVPPGGVGQ